MTDHLVKFAFAAAMLALPVPAMAHAKLVQSIPEAKSIVAAPASIELQFSEALEPKFSGLDVLSADGGKVDLVAAEPANVKTLSATPKIPFVAGAYKVSWHVVSADGHKSSGTYDFTVK